MFKKFLQAIGILRLDDKVMHEQFGLLSAFFAHATTAQEMMNLRRDVLNFRARWANSESGRELIDELFDKYDKRLKFVKMLMVRRIGHGEVTKEARKTT